MPGDDSLGSVLSKDVDGAAALKKDWISHKRRKKAGRNNVKGDKES